MKRERVAAYLVPSTDPHMSEYLPECWKRRGWLSGFTGSAGDVVVTQREALLWTDSRYFLEAEAVLDPQVFRLMKIGLETTPSIEAYLGQRLKRGDTVGADPQTLSKARAEALEEALAKKGIALRFPKRNLVDEIWRDRPPLPDEPVSGYPERRAGESVRSKLTRMRGELVRLDVDAHVVTALDAIAWLFNLRGNDVEFNPVAVAYAIVDRRGARLFIAPEKVPAELRLALRGLARIAPYRDVGKALRELGRRRRRVLVDPAWTNRWVLDQLGKAQIRYAPSPAIRAKAIKTRAELRGMQAAHVQDGLALVRFYHWLEGALAQRRYTESELADRLEVFRQHGRLYRGPSFDTIVGFGANGAIIHYRPRPGRDAVVKRRGILLIDSGGQYLNGTTDVTRTTALGRPTREERKLFTLVLKAHINLARTRFPRGTQGSVLEALSRQPLWMAGEHYLHGTGHGVGCYLNVHEGPIGFSARASQALEPGNVLSLEPGCYKDGRYGFRTENLVFVASDPGVEDQDRTWCRLEPLTLCPFDRSLIDVAYLAEEETRWIDDYHRRVYRVLAQHLQPPVRRWLRAATLPL